MNRVYKTKWSAAHQQYVVTDEHHATKGKASKSAVALAIAGLMMAAAANAAYSEKGFVASSSENYEEAVQSWETAEYKAPWGLTALKASKAYALGYHGQGVKLGIMDSGALMSHPDFAEGRLSVTEVTGTYGQSGNRYPQNGPVNKNTGAYNEGDSFNVTGDFMLGVNDSHGTKVAGTMGSDRNGVGSHGVSWGAQLVSGNTGGDDNTNYGPFLDYQFFKKGYDALVAEGVKIINNSFGTNVKQYTKDESGKVTMEPYSVSGIELTTVQDVEYEYFLFKAAYNGKKSFVDAAWEAVEGHDVIQVFTNGNNNRDNPYHRALYPYFNPAAEKQWIAIAGIEKTKNDPNKYQLKDDYNEAGFAKYWTLAGPGSGGYTTGVDKNTGKPIDDQKNGYENGFTSFGGTSMAAPFVSGAFGVLASRYTEMDATQVREVLLTTANHKNSDGNDFEGWNNKDGSTPAPGEVSDRLGWGIPDLEKGMYGPGQLLGKFEYKMNTEGSFDLWSNDISQVALDQRKREELAWLKSVTDNGEITGTVQADKGGDYKVKNDKFIAGLEDVQNIDPAKAKEWRQEYFDKRAAAIRDKIANDLYDGHLIKDGVGTLVVTGNNTYRGGTTVEGGTLLGFAESFGVTGDDAQAKANGKVVVNGGTFGLIEKYNDQFTMKGELNHNKSADHSVDAVVNAGGTFMIAAGQNVTMGNLEFKEGAGFTVGSTDVDVLKEAYAGTAQSGTVTVTNVVGADLAVANPDYAFFKTELKADDKKLTGTISRDETKSFATYASDANGSAIAAALEAAGDGDVFDTLLLSSKGDIAKTYESLGDDFVLNTRNAGITNGMMLTRAVKDQAAGIGEGRMVEMADGTGRLWATGVGGWSTIDYGKSDMDSDFYAGLFGAEVDVCPATKIGLFFGAGTTENKAGAAKLESDDIHFGIYGLTNIGEKVGTTYGLVYTHQSADANRTLQLGNKLGANAFSGDTDMMQLFAEASWKGFNTANYSFEPYFGLSWIHASSDGFDETVGTTQFSTSMEDQDLQVTTLGVRGAVPFNLGETNFAVKGDLAWNHFFGDTEAEAAMTLGTSGVATIKGGELSDMASVGLGVEAQLGKSTTFGVSYTGAYDGDITSHGMYANIRFNF